MASTEAPKRTRARKPASANGNGNTAITVVPEDFLRVIRFLDTQVLVERALELRVILLGSLAGVNIHQLGPPGTAKSLGLREYAQCIVGATFDGDAMQYFEKPLNAGLVPDAVIGAYDMEQFARNGKFERNVEGYAPTAHIIFLDEWFRANGLMLDALLPLANTEERKYEANGGMKKANVRVLVSASNHMPDADNEQAQALVDRITLMSMVEPVKADDSFMEMVRRHHARRTAELSGQWTRETITLAQLDVAQREVMQVRPTAEFLEAAAKLRRDAVTAGLYVSDRRWIELYRVARANAWLAGRDHLIAEDLAVVEHGLWRDREQIAEAHKLVLPFHGRFEREATAKRQEAAPHLAKLESIRPLVEGTPPTENLDDVRTGDGESVLRIAVSVCRAIDRLATDVDKVLAEAEEEKRDAASLRDLANELLAARMWLHANSLPTQYQP